MKIDQHISIKGCSYSNYNIQDLSKELNIEEHEIRELLTEMQAELYYASIKNKFDDKYCGIY